MTTERDPLKPLMRAVDVLYELAVDGTCGGCGEMHYAADHRADVRAAVRRVVTLYGAWQRASGELEEARRCDEDEPIGLGAAHELARRAYFGEEKP